MPLSQERKTFSGIFIPFFESAQSFVDFEKKHQLYSLNILEFSESEKCGYMIPRKVLFQKTLRESKCSRVLNTADATMAALLSKLFIDPAHIDLEKVSVTEISNLRNVW